LLASGSRKLPPLFLLPRDGHMIPLFLEAVGALCGSRGEAVEDALLRGDPTNKSGLRSGGVTKMPPIEAESSKVDRVDVVETLPRLVPAVVANRLRYRPVGDFGGGVGGMEVLSSVSALSVA
jgi:hypothetical protein